MPPTERPKKKSLRACERCRSMKVKCSGSHPCSRCTRSNRSCHFPVEEVRVSVSERYLRELEEQITRSATSGRYTTSVGQEHQALPPLTRNEAVDFSPTPNATTYLPPDDQQTAGWQIASDDSPTRNPGGRVGTRERQECHDSEFSKNPLVDKKEWAFAATPDGRYWYMGPSSSWSFCRRVLALLGKRVPESNSPPDPWHLDGMAFKLQWKQVPPEESPDVTNIPPLDYALFLYNTAKYYLASLSFLIDETLYLQELHEFYLDPAAKAASRRSWFAQYLLVLAFGKAFITQRNPSGSPPGHQYASRAMALLPDLSGIHEDPLSSIQALSLAALYFQSIDMRKAAFHHIGQALRCCITEGIHRHVPEELGGPEFSQRCRAVFWVVYMLDREFSALMGGPNSIRDEDITVRLPAEVASSVENTNLTLHVRLARLMAQILTTVYGVDNASNGALIRDIQSILHALADLSQDITEFLDSSFHGTVGRGSKMAVRLMLAQHHCVVLTTRPLVMCALNMHIDSAERQSSRSICLSPPVASLLQCCADSAQTILQTLRSLADDDLMDAFLPFQVEHASSSAFVLYLIRSIAPSLIANESWCDNLDCVIEKLISKGNPAAPLRKLELKHLDLMLTPLTPRSATHAMLPMTSDEIQDNNDDTYALDQVDIGDEVEWDLLALSHSVSLPPRELLDLADQLDVDSIIQSMDA
ncbi:fungal-specific transcription factor domain-containing protein [Aspergillus pseudonomiae]|uniref:Fungal-specific transcription factor domain-containing protein n=1 Tax=Aspergillus pseudonomiae TaxID=1506151 RepID=A0A5N6HTA6_9EURO|nr:fungal-specific transcription factor domain-containing protein [Aspergillus pseudonomiae]KAB8256879.1 fungal-specific transcription factor domain-containing protein [Aspergillus pseudonomiae]KAE8401810.1 fungal-specific transcription factor domain-containing protein [Aspergillus pseudonomiae]